MKFFVVVEGGIGNQLFQASMAEFLCSKYEGATPIFLVANSAHDIKRHCELESIGYRTVNMGLVLSFILKIVRWVVAKWGARAFFLVDSGSWNSSLPPRLPRLVFGYWQYHEMVSSVLPKISNRVNDYSIRIGMGGNVSSPDLAVHVRCGDYRNNPVVAAKHLVCTNKYFSNAVDYLSRRINVSFRIKVYTDDPVWVRSNINEFDFDIEPDRTGSALIELISLSRHEHYVLSNSTFSWWAAMLSANSEKIVVVPDRWFVDVPTDTLGIVPDAWIQLPCFL